jgi:hypothetical protein
MSRIIKCQVNDEYLLGSGVVIGAAGSHGDVILQLQFNDMWEGLSIMATFRDAMNENPVAIMLMPSMLVIGETRTYEVHVPAEAKRIAGRARLTLSGYSVYTINDDGAITPNVDSLTNTATAFFRVLESDSTIADDGSITPTIAQQLQAEITKMSTDLNSELDALDGKMVKIDEATHRANEAAGNIEDAGKAIIEAEEKVIDNLLKKADEALQIAQECGDSELKVMSQKATTEAIDTAKDEITKNMAPILSENLCNPKELTMGYILADGTLIPSTYYHHTGHISVSEGDVITVAYVADGVVTKGWIWRVCAYDQDGNVIADAGANANGPDYTVPATIKSIRISFNVLYENVMVLKNYTGLPSEYIEYWTDGYVATEKFFNDIVYTTEEVDARFNERAEATKEVIYSTTASLDTFTDVTDTFGAEKEIIEKVFDATEDGFVMGHAGDNGIDKKFTDKATTPLLELPSHAKAIEISAMDFVPCDAVNTRMLYLAQYDASGVKIATTQVTFDGYDEKGNYTGHTLSNIGAMCGPNKYAQISVARAKVVLVTGARKFCVYNFTRVASTGVVDAIDMQIYVNRAIPITVERRTVKKEGLPFACKVVSNNLFDKATSTTAESVYLGKTADGKAQYGWYLNSIGGASNGVSSTGFDSTSTAIEVENGVTYYKSHASIINLFDDNDCRVAPSEAIPFEPAYFTVPDGVKYVRISFVSAHKEVFRLIKGDKPWRLDAHKIALEGVSVEQYKELNEVLTRNGLEAGYMQQYAWDIAKEAYKYIAPDRHTFIFVADTHAQDVSNKIMCSVAEMSKYVPCSYIAHGGDIIDGKTDKEQELLILSTLVRNGNEAKCPTYYIKGNHDYNRRIEDGNIVEAEVISNAEIASRTNCFIKSGVKGNIEKMYFFVDDATSKVRSIFLNVFLTPELSANTQRMGQEQFEWLINEALDFSDKEDKAEWGVIAFAHQLPKNEGLYEILKAFQVGGREEYSVTEGDETFNISADFTAQGTMEIISMFVGDIHFDSTSRITANKPYPCIYILNASLANDYANTSLGSNNALKPPDKVANTENETAFDIVTIDRKNKLLYMTRYGARSYVYNEETEAYDTIANRTRIFNYETVSYTQLI